MTAVIPAHAIGCQNRAIEETRIPEAAFCGGLLWILYDGFPPLQAVETQRHYRARRRAFAE